jgi:nitrogen fixation-related uncharacterized protein
VSWLYAGVWALTVVFAASAVWALAWAVKTGHFSGFAEQARSIFDAEEPVGRPTDASPPGYAQDVTEGGGEDGRDG